MIFLLVFSKVLVKMWCSTHLCDYFWPNMNDLLDSPHDQTVVLELTVQLIPCIESLPDQRCSSDVSYWRRTNDNASKYMWMQFFSLGEDHNDWNDSHLMIRLLWQLWGELEVPRYLENLRLTTLYYKWEDS